MFELFQLFNDDVHQDYLLGYNIYNQTKESSFYLNFHFVWTLKLSAHLFVLDILRSVKMLSQFFEQKHTLSIAYKSVHLIFIIFLKQIIHSINNTNNLIIKYFPSFFFLYRTIQKFNFYKSPSQIGQIEEEY